VERRHGQLKLAGATERDRANWRGRIEFETRARDRGADTAQATDPEPMHAAQRIKVTGGALRRRSPAPGASVLTAGLGPNPTPAGNGALHEHTFVVGVWPPIATAHDRISPALIHGDEGLGRFRSVERHELRTSA